MITPYNKHLCYLLENKANNTDLFHFFKHIPIESKNTKN